jgi:hypothetical protein
MAARVSEIILKMDDEKSSSKSSTAAIRRLKSFL